MLDIKQIRENPGAVRDNLAKRRDEEKLELLERVISIDKEWRQVVEEANKLKHERNVVSKSISELKREGKDAAAELQRASELPKELEKVEEKRKELEASVRQGLMRLPNILHESVPVGADDSDNLEVSSWGDIPAKDFEIKAHGELLESLGMADFERARKVAGAGFLYMMGPLVQLDQALINFALDLLIERGYIPVEPPFMIRREPYEGVTDLEDFESVMYKIEGEDLYLIATSEHPIAAMYQGEIIDEDALPLKYAGFSTNFRREIGSRGVDTRGLFRMHQFNKVEQFIFSTPEDSWTYHEELLKNAEDLHQMLEIPYRVVNDCTGDIGTVAAKKYDIEAWSPRQGKYVEVVSCSNCTDYQARRLRIRVGKVGGEKRVLHTLNSTALATSRTLVAILENNQTADGSVTVPKALRPYMKGMEVITAKTQ
ncbi:MAG: serine--tRNA ligase [Candidatus Thermoplasmatota archaeon]|nr:serine--tRNA ligase [Candidatus Thermoplasmatota archaeon]